MLCKGVRAIIFKETKERSRSILYCVSQNRFSVRHPIQSEKYEDAKSNMSNGFVPYFKDNYHEYLRDYLSISKRNKPTIFPNLNAKSVDFPVTGEVML